MCISSVRECDAKFYKCQSICERCDKQSLSSSLALKAELSTDLKGQTRLWNDADLQQSTQPSLPSVKIYEITKIPLQR